MVRLFVLAILLLLAACGEPATSPSETLSGEPAATDGGPAATDDAAATDGAVAATDGTDEDSPMSCDDAVGALPDAEELAGMHPDDSVQLLGPSLQACASVEEWQRAWGDGITDQQVEALLNDICDGATDVSGTDICAEVAG